MKTPAERRVRKGLAPVCNYCLVFHNPRQQGGAAFTTPADCGISQDSGECLAARLALTSSLRTLRSKVAGHRWPGRPLFAHTVLLTRRPHYDMGQWNAPNATRLVLTEDCSGSIARTRSVPFSMRSIRRRSSLRARALLLTQLIPSSCYKVRLVTTLTRFSV